MKVKKYVKCLTALFMSGAILVMAQTNTLNYVKAAEIRKEQTKELLENATKDMEEEKYVEGEALVTLEASEVAALVQEGKYRYDNNIRVEDVCEFGEKEDTIIKRYIVRLTSDKYSTEELMEIALNQYIVDGVSPNGEFKLMENSNYNDPYKKSQWYLDGSLDNKNIVSNGINFSKNKISMQETPVIAVLDTGVNYNHPDLADNMWINPYPDKLMGKYGYDFGDNDSDPIDTYGHGTHVAGIAAATQDNEIGIIGISNAQIMALKIAKDNSDSISQWAIIKAYEYVEDALKNGVNIKAVNCSWGGNSDSNGLLSKAITAVGELGALSVFAAGNDSKDWDNVPERMRNTPYDLDSPYVVIVGATNENDKVAYYSDYSSKMVDVFAPGSNIISTYYEDLYTPRIYDDTLQRKLTSYYNKFSDDKENILLSGSNYKDVYLASQIGVATDYDIKKEWVRDNNEEYIRLEIIKNNSNSNNQVEKEVAGSIYVDVTDLNLNVNDTYYVGCMIGNGEDDEISWENVHFVSEQKNSRFVVKNNKTYMRIVGLQIQNNNIGKKNTIYIDDIGISIANPDTKLFGQYAYMEGTSMATPVVSGVIATFAASNSSMDASTLRTEILKCVRKVSDLENKCVTGGIIDCSKLSQKVTAVKLNKTTATLKYGKTLTLKVKVTPKKATNIKVKWKSSNTKYATVNSKGIVKAKKKGIGHTVKIMVTTTDGSKKQDTCKVRIKK